MIELIGVAFQGVCAAALVYIALRSAPKATESVSQAAPATPAAHHRRPRHSLRSDLVQVLRKTHEGWAIEGWVREGSEAYQRAHDDPAFAFKRGDSIDQGATE